MKIIKNLILIVSLDFTSFPAVAPSTNVDIERACARSAKSRQSCFLSLRSESCGREVFEYDDEWRGEYA